MATPVRRRTTGKTDTKRSAPTADRYRSKAADVDDDDLDDDDDLEDDEDDEDEEDTRASRRKARRTPPARRSARRDEDDEDDDEDDDDDEDEDEDDELSRRRRRRAAPRDEDDDDDDDEDERPARRGRGQKSSAGWGAYKKKRETMGSFANELRVPDEEQILLKFLDDEPFCTYGLHWIRNDRGTRSYICLEDGCPLCDKAGDTPRPMAALNVLVLDEEAEPKLTVWAVGPGIAQLLEKKAAAKTGPLTKEYYTVSKVKTGRSNKGPVQYQIDVVRSRDLLEEWGVEPLTDRDLAKHAKKAWDEEKFLKRPNKAELKAVAREAMDEDD